MSSISILMSTYNGEKYILEQLDSLRVQKRVADEVIIIDDASTDRTAQIVEEYLDRYNLKNWKIYVNQKNQGWQNNFLQGLQQCSGEYIFTCDQDDIWEPFKIQEMSEILDQNKQILLLASNYKSFYQKDGVITREEEMADEGTIEKYPFNEQLLFIRRPGCVYAIRKSLLSYIDMYAFDKYPHDAFLWRTALMLDGLYIYNRMTIRYRRHEQTATGREKKSGVHKVETMRYYVKVLASMQRFVEREDISDKSEKLRYIMAAQQWCRYRLKALIDADIFAWVKLLQYRKYYYNNVSWLADLLMLNDYKNQ